MKQVVIRCDRCGDAYDPTSPVKEDVEINGTYPYRLVLKAVPNTGVETSGQAYEPVDLCPSCRTHLADWWDIK